MGTVKQYDKEYKKQAVKLANEIGNKAAADELGIPKGTLGTWHWMSAERHFMTI